MSGEVDKTTSPSECPNCGSGAIKEIYSTETLCGQSIKQIECEICGSRWLEDWKCTGWMWNDGSPKMQNTNK